MIERVLEDNGREKVVARYDGERLAIIQMFIDGKILQEKTIILNQQGNDNLFGFLKEIRK